MLLNPYSLPILIISDVVMWVVNDVIPVLNKTKQSLCRYLTEAEPWKMKGKDESRRPAIVRTTLEALYAFMHLLAPVLPMAGQAGMFQ